MIKYPKNLNSIFETLYKNNIRPIIVGGYIRDSLLHVDSNDIDIELYGINSLDTVKKILEKFGNVNSVGKSFGVCKLQYHGLDLDFSLPREDSKVAAGHQGFVIKLHKNLDFATAASRRDFTINAIGYDVKNKKILDPYNGREDLDKKILRAVCLQKFLQDPLRVLRAIVFYARFDLKLEKELLLTCKDMIAHKLLHELPKERIFQEIKKLLLKSTIPSKGFYLLKDLGAFSFFQEFYSLSEKEYSEVLHNIDLLKSCNITNEKIFVILALALLTRKFSDKERLHFLHRLTNEKKLISDINNINTIIFDYNNISNYNIYNLATKIDIQSYYYYLHVQNKKECEQLFQKAKELGLLHQALTPLLQGKDLIKEGLQASKEFSLLLKEAYEAQMHEEFHTKKDAILWLKKRFLQEK